MKILHLTTFLQGGAGLAIAELAVAQRAAGHCVAVVTSKTGEPGYGNYQGHLDTLVRAGVPLHLVDSSFKRDVGLNLNVASFVDGMLADTGIDVIHAHAAVPSLIALIVAGRSIARPRIVQTMHGWGINKTARDQQHDVSIMNLVDRIAVPAVTSARFLQSIGVDKRRMRVVPYGVRPHADPVAAGDETMALLRAWKREGRLVIACLGTIGPRKNQRVLVDAVAEMGGDVRCLFVGDGECDELRRAADNAGVGRAVHVTGYRPSARHYLSQTDLFVLPSLSEGQPLSILEAYCDRVPVLASDIPELAELVEDHITGFLFDPRDPSQLARTVAMVRRLSPAKRQQVCARARDRYDTRFSVEAMVNGYTQLYTRSHDPHSDDPTVRQRLECLQPDVAGAVRHPVSPPR